MITTATKVKTIRTTHRGYDIFLAPPFHRLRLELRARGVSEYAVRDFLNRYLGFPYWVGVGDDFPGGPHPALFGRHGQPAMADYSAWLGSFAQALKVAKNDTLARIGYMASDEFVDAMDLAPAAVAIPGDGYGTLNPFHEVVVFEIAIEV